MNSNIESDVKCLCELSKVIKDVYKCKKFKIFYYVPMHIKTLYGDFKEAKKDNVFIKYYDQNNMKKSLRNEINQLDS